MASTGLNPNFLPQAIAAKEIRVSNTNLYRIAAREYGDATLWTLIAEENGLTDPWITGTVTLLIPAASVSNGGILTPG